jgi:predicted XRE-type DNA-binding protein
MTAKRRIRRSQHHNNVFTDLGFAEAEAENLRIRSHLMTELVDLVGGMTQVQAAEFLGVSQPRVSHLRTGKINLFTIDALVNMLAQAGVRLNISLRRRRKSSAA